MSSSFFLNLALFQQTFKLLFTERFELGVIVGTQLLRFADVLQEPPIRSKLPGHRLQACVFLRQFPKLILTGNNLLLTQ